MTWVVLGASGFVGSALVAALRAAGETVHPLPAPRLASRHRDASDLVGEARTHPAVPALAAALAGADVVVLAAGSATPDAPEDGVLVGANALLPGVVALACQTARVPRMVHLSSAAVQGRAAVLDESGRTQPFSPYSRSKALGEEVLDQLRPTCRTDLVVVRATSVQGAGRPTTANLQRVARSRLASVAGAGTRPSPVSSVGGLAAFVHHVGRHPAPVPPVVLQPWAGLTAGEVLRLAGGREPQHLPAAVCRVLVALGYRLSPLVRGRLDGPVRRVEAMWFGQEVDDAWARQRGLRTPTDVAEVLRTPARNRLPPTVAA